MRYVLTILGAGAIVIGGVNWSINWGESEAHLAPIKFLVQAGVVFVALGLATIDIVAAIRQAKK